MKPTRREFVSTMALAAMGARYIHAAAARTPLAFSTLGCPAWTWPQILDFAEQYGFAAVELRGLLGDMNLPARPEFAADKIPAAKRDVAAHGLKIASVSSSAEMHVADPQKRAQQLSDARKFIDLAAALGAPYVRVFGNKIEGPREEVIARVSSGLHELGEYARPRNVTVIIESHGDFTDSPTLKEVLMRADSEGVALLWDAHHTFAASHEEPEFTVAQLGKWIRHTHLKDSVPEGKDRHYVLTGKGDVPVKRQVEALVKINYTGFYCFEWEKVWHPDLLEPEVAFPNYVKVVSEYLRQA
ncbi:MAG TPA: sugar phosphate isomerase/epimerase family protein [Candidatus Acidoferrales bacterium]|nr:sugar phosphate isomerase/epimerase family protein [Candidatus Acidoferrales bacterium]